MSTKINRSQIVILLFLILVFNCSSNLPLPNVDSRILELSQKMTDHCFFEASEDITPTLLEFKSILDEIYKGQGIPQEESRELKCIYEGCRMEPYPPEEDVAGAIVARPIAASLYKFIVALLWDNQMEVFTDRYTLYEREYVEGDKDEFINGNQDFISCNNHVIDLGQRGISFEYDRHTTFTRHKGNSLPPDGVIVECMEMIGEAERVAGGYNAHMTKLRSLIIYYPIDASNTYRIVGTWLKAGGSLWIFGADANSGDVGEGIISEFEGITNFVLNPGNFN